MKDFIKSIQDRDREIDPSTLEVIFAYPGFHSMVIFYPLAHALNRAGLKTLARIWSYVCRVFTGVEIHPGAVIGKNLFIDHGSGVVIGQTAIIGDDCTIYHGVTLGGRGTYIAPGARRHPKVGNNVVIGAGATLIGAITVGDNAQIGAGSVVTIDVPPGITAVGNPARLIDKRENHPCAYGLPDGMLPDPLMATIEGLEKELRSLRSALNISVPSVIVEDNETVFD